MAHLMYLRFPKQGIPEGTEEWIKDGSESRIPSGRVLKSPSQPLQGDHSPLFSELTPDPEALIG